MQIEPNAFKLHNEIGNNTIFEKKMTFHSGLI